VVSRTKGKTQIEGIREQGTKENIWTTREEVAGGWRRLRNEELHNLYTSRDIVRVM
jgi:hypothetical protein